MGHVFHATSTYLLLYFLKHVSILLDPPLSFCQLIAAFAKDLSQHRCHTMQKFPRFHNFGQCPKLN